MPKHKANFPFFATAQRFYLFVQNRFIEDNALGSASALAYTTLLSLIPLLVVTYAILTAFPLFTNAEEQLRSFIFRNLVPASGEVVQEYIMQFMQHSSRLTAVGVASLVVTALLMLQTIDVSLNRIWRTTQDRPLIRSFMIYWVVLTLGPLLIGAGAFVTASLLSIPWLAQMQDSLWLIWLPFVSSTMAFALFYMIIPNRLVPFRHALLGGLFAAALFGLAKKAFALYAIHSSVYQTLYGVMSVIPMFLVWIYVSWVVVLLGAEVTYCLGVFNWKHADTEVHETDNRFLLAFRLLGYLWEAQCKGKGMTEKFLYTKEPNQPIDLVNAILIQLEQGAYVTRIDRNQWLLVRDLGEIKLIDLYRLMSGGFSHLTANEHNADNEPTHPWDEQLHPILARLQGQASQLMDVPLKILYQHPETSTPVTPPIHPLF